MPAPYRPNMAALLVFGLWVAAAGFPCVMCSAESVGFEAAFQGECRVDGPCQQMCFDLHDGTFECGCTPGYRLSSNGYSCQLLQQGEPEPENRHKGEAPTVSASDVKQRTTSSGAVYLRQTPLMRRRMHGNSIGTPGSQMRPASPDEGSAGDTEYENNVDVILGEDADLSRQQQQHRGIGASQLSRSVGHKRASQSGAEAADGWQGDDPGPAAASWEGDRLRSWQEDDPWSEDAPYPSDKQRRRRGPATEAGGEGSRYEPPLNTIAMTTVATTGDQESVLAPGLTSPCQQLSCSRTGRCVQDERTGSVRCACALGYTGAFCDQEVDLRRPRFSGSSYLALPTLRDAHKSMQITLQFRPETHDALLLYSGETAELQGDYFAILLSKGFVEFRFDCGMGPGTLRSDQPVLLNAWNTLTVYRDRWDAWMQLNSGHQVQGRSKGLFSRITLRLNVYLGGSPNASLAAGRLGVREGLVGCIRHLEINGRRYDFRSTSLRGDAIEGLDVDECGGDGCSGVSCQNGGQCIANGVEQGVCLCALGFAGASCETPVEIVVPSFNGSSYLRFPGLGNDHLSFLDVQLVMKPLSPHGVFFYNGAKMDGTGDFASLQMADGHVEFRFDLSTGTAVLRSPFSVALGEWHIVKASRTGRLGTLKIDGQPRVEAHSPGAFTQLSLPLNLYLGGVPDPKETAVGADIMQSFVGCVQKLTINNRPVRLMQEALSGVNVENCVHPCVTGPCYNGGACQPRMDLYACHCKLGYAGSNCQNEVKEAIAEPMMGGASYLHYTSDDIMRRIRGDQLDVVLAFRSFSSHGLLFWAGDSSQQNRGTLYSPSDYLSLGLEKGLLTLRFNLGSGEAQLCWNTTRVDDGRWHRAALSRSRQLATLGLDGTSPVAVTSPGRLRQLNVRSGLYIGGIGDVAHVTRGRYKSGLVGCVANLTLASNYHVRLVSHAATGINVQPCL
ncbi:pikachurin isoform X1 [Rhipicephalus microplus]|uniref:pikachurin isoform X1 n=1 Tax=Rhipicephalus microplus TaxID=6941 RepID=UPI003F6BF806